MIIIGSSAIKYWYSDFPREPKDLDGIIFEYQKYDEFSEMNQPTFGPRIEYLKNKVISNLFLDARDKNGCISNTYLKPDTLTTLKASHLCWDINWSKHMWDLQFLLKKGNKIDFKLFKELYNHWNTVHSKNKRSDLKMSKEDFFNNAVNYDYLEHDEIHKILNLIPIYTKCLKDGEEVELDENKFNELSYEDKLEFIREEIYVMSYERYKELGWKRAYNRMLKKFILSHAPFWSLIFIFENYIELQKCPKNYIKEIENGITIRKGELNTI
jgi:hypothetical protein